MWLVYSDIVISKYVYSVIKSLLHYFHYFIILASNKSWYIISFFPAICYFDNIVVISSFFSILLLLQVTSHSNITSFFPAIYYFNNVVVISSFSLFYYSCK